VSFILLNHFKVISQSISNPNYQVGKVMYNIAVKAAERAFEESKETEAFFDKGGSLTFEKECEQLGKRECSVVVDDPGWDGTGYEHPAYDRGQKRAVDNVVSIISKVLDGKGNRSGTFGNSGLEDIRRRIIKLMDSVEDD